MKYVITQTGSKIGLNKKQAASLAGLSLGKRHKTVTLNATPAILGMVNKVKHVLKVKTIQ